MTGWAMLPVMPVPVLRAPQRVRKESHFQLTRVTWQLRMKIWEFAAKTTMLNSINGHKEASPCLFSMN